MILRCWGEPLGCSGRRASEDQYSDSVSGAESHCTRPRPTPRTRRFVGNGQNVEIAPMSSFRRPRPFGPFSQGAVAEYFKPRSVIANRFLLSGSIFTNSQNFDGDNNFFGSMHIFGA